MGHFRNTSTGDSFSVPAELDAMYHSRPEFVEYDPTATELVVDPAATAPAGSTGVQPQPFDPEQPLAAGPQVALDNLEDIKGAALDQALIDLDLSHSGTVADKRDRLAERLNKEVSGA